MTVGELLSQVHAMLHAGFITGETPVLSDGCDCYGAAVDAVGVDFGEDGMPSGRRHLLIARSRAVEGVRAPDTSARTFTTTEAKGS